jgi:tight adherence protein C
VVSFLSLVAALCAAASILLLLGGLARMRRPNSLRDRLDWVARRAVEHELHKPLFDRTLRPMLAGIAMPIERLAPRNSLESVQRQIVHADMTGKLDAATFMALRSIGGVGFGVLAAALAFIATGPSALVLLVGIAGGGMAFILPALWLGGKARRRQAEIRAALPDALDLLTLCIDTMTIERAIGRLVEKSRNALRIEFAHVLTAVALNVPLVDALRAMADRVGIEELNSVVTSIAQAMHLGTPMNQVLRNISEDMRVKRRQRAETLARQAPIKMMFPLVFLVFPPLFIVILGPAIPQVLHSLVPGLKL